jgi:hypothetical protein
MHGAKLVDQERAPIQAGAGLAEYGGAWTVQPHEQRDERRQGREQNMNNACNKYVKAGTQNCH